MSFGGGGSGALTNHVHDNTPLQGGPLNFNNTTIGGMNSGDMTYSDGAALQQLAIAAPNDQLRVSAGNIPEWFTPAAGGSNYEFLASSSGTNVTSISVNFAAVQPPDYVVVTYAGTVTAGQGADWRINTLATGTYDSQGSYYSGGAETILNTTGDNKLYGALSSIAGSGFLVYLKAFINPLSSNIYYQTESYSDANGYSNIAGRNTTGAQTGITDIELFIASPFSGTVSVWAVRN